MLRHERRGAYGCHGQRGGARKAAGATQMRVFEPTFDRVLQVYVVSSAAQPSSKSVFYSTHEQSKSRLPDAWTSHEFELWMLNDRNHTP